MEITKNLFFFASKKIFNWIFFSVLTQRSDIISNSILNRNLFIQTEPLNCPHIHTRVKRSIRHDIMKYHESLRPKNKNRRIQYIILSLVARTKTHRRHWSNVLRQCIYIVARPCFPSSRSSWQLERAFCIQNRTKHQILIASCSWKTSRVLLLFSLPSLIRLLKWNGLRRTCRWDGELISFDIWFDSYITGERLDRPNYNKSLTNRHFRMATVFCGGRKRNCMRFDFTTVVMIFGERYY